MSAGGTRHLCFEREIARVQPGANFDQLRRYAEKGQLTHGPDTVTHTHNTFGGMLGNNSCGIRSVMSGCTAVNTCEMEIMTSDGLRLQVGEPDDGYKGLES